jgi:hypothetical protein
LTVRFSGLVPVGVAWKLIPTDWMSEMVKMLLSPRPPAPAGP